jgi:uncharacterized Zn finger protein
MGAMAPSKKPERRPENRKKLQTQLRLHPVMREQLEKLVDRNFTSLTTEITEAIRKHLQANSLWPPTDHAE